MLLLIYEEIFIAKNRNISRNKYIKRFKKGMKPVNISLHKLRKQLKRDKSAQGGLLAVFLAGLVGSILISSATSWYLSMRNGLGNVADKLEAQTIAQSEWERLSHMSLDELEAKRGELAEKYSAGTGSQYQISVNLGEKGTFNGGTCGAIGSDGYANCFKDTTITVYRDGNRMFTTRTLPLMAETYTRKEIDDKFASLLRLEPIDEKAEIPEGKALYAYLDGQKLPVSQGGGTPPEPAEPKLPEPDYDNPKFIYITNWSQTSSKPQDSYPAYGPPYFFNYYDGTFIMPETGFLEQDVKSSTGFGWHSICGSVGGCAEVGYNASLKAPGSSVYNAYLKKGTAVSVSAQCGESAASRICNLSKLNDFYAVYYPPK